MIGRKWIGAALVVAVLLSGLAPVLPASTANAQGDYTVNGWNGYYVGTGTLSNVGWLWLGAVPAGTTSYYSISGTATNTGGNGSWRFGWVCNGQSIPYYDGGTGRVIVLSGGNSANSKLDPLNSDRYCGVYIYADAGTYLTIAASSVLFSPGNIGIVNPSPPPVSSPTPRPTPSPTALPSAACFGSPDPAGYSPPCTPPPSQPPPGAVWSCGPQGGGSIYRGCEDHTTVYVPGNGRLVVTWAIVGGGYPDSNWTDASRNDEIKLLLTFGGNYPVTSGDAGTIDWGNGAGLNRVTGHYGLCRGGSYATPCSGVDDITNASSAIAPVYMRCQNNDWYYSSTCQASARTFNAAGIETDPFSPSAAASVAPSPSGSAGAASQPCYQTFLNDAGVPFSVIVPCPSPGTGTAPGGGTVGNGAGAAPGGGSTGCTAGTLGCLPVGPVTGPNGGGIGGGTTGIGSCNPPAPCASGRPGIGGGSGYGSIPGNAACPASDVTKKPGYAKLEQLPIFSATDPLDAILKAVLSIPASILNVIRLAWNFGVDAVIPGDRLLCVMQGAATTLSGRIPFSYVAAAVTDIQSSLAYTGAPALSADLVIGSTHIPVSVPAMLAQVTPSLAPYRGIMAAILYIAVIFRLLELGLSTIGANSATKQMELGL